MAVLYIFWTSFKLTCWYWDWAFWSVIIKWLRACNGCILFIITQGRWSRDMNMFPPYRLPIPPFFLVICIVCITLSFGGSLLSLQKATWGPHVQFLYWLYDVILCHFRMWSFKFAVISRNWSQLHVDILTSPSSCSYEKHAAIACPEPFD